MIRIGICGSGFMGTMHAICYGRMRGVRVAAVASKEPASGRALARTHQADFYGDAADLIARADVDVVDLCLPTYLHADYAVQAARRGRALFCEKPLARTLPEADRMVRAVRRAGIPAMVGHCIRFWPEYVALQRLYERGVLGSLRALSLCRYQGKVRFGWRNWFKNPALSGGAFLDFHIHDADFLRRLLGEPAGLDSVGTYFWNSTNYRYPGMVVHSEAGWSTADPFEMRFRAVFDRGVLLYSSRQQPLTLYRAGRDPVPVRLPAAASGEAQAGGNISDSRAYFEELRYFIAHVRRDRLPATASFEDARATLALVLREMRQAGLP